MSDQKLWDELRANPANAKSSIQITAEQREQERLRALQGVKKPVTQSERESAEQRFRAIKAQRAAEKATAELDIVNQRTREIEHDIRAALEVASPTEQTQVMATITPAMLRHFALNSTNFDIVEYVNAELQRLRAAKVLGL